MMNNFDNPESNQDELVWSDVSSVGIPILDRENQGLLVVIVQLRELLTAEAIKDDVLGIIRKLFDYATTHFSNEENILRGKGSEFLEFQEVHHAIFLDYLIEVEQKVKSDDTSVIPELYTFLHSWWTEHILKVDRESLG